MRIAVIGGGFAGLTAAYYLRKKGHDVVIFEKEAFLGGLASGFQAEGWNWHLERAYHHLFTNDEAILGFAKETGFEGMMQLNAVTSSLYEVGGQLRQYKLDSPLDLLRFPLISFPDRIRSGLVLAFLKLSPFLPLYEKETTAGFLKKYMGIQGWEQMFEQIFRKKFGKYAENILASFIWARVTKRSKDLVYVEKGFQDFLKHIKTVLEKNGVEIRLETGVTDVRKSGGKFAVKVDVSDHVETFDRVVCTLPTPVVPFVCNDLFSKEYAEKLKKIQYLGAVNLIIESDTPLMEDTYWLSICVERFPMLVMVQHTNFISKKHYGGKHLLYVANYLERGSELWNKSEDQIFETMQPYLEELKNGFSQNITRRWVFKAPFAQPIFDTTFIQNVPSFETPVPGFYMANLDMTYPYDRGTNYAVDLGKRVTEVLR